MYEADEQDHQGLLYGHIIVNIHPNPEGTQNLVSLIISPAHMKTHTSDGVDFPILPNPIPALNGVLWFMVLAEMDDVTFGNQQWSYEEMLDPSNLPDGRSLEMTCQVSHVLEPRRQLMIRSKTLRLSFSKPPSRHLIPVKLPSNLFLGPPHTFATD